jgi:predicted transcriptional regulator
VSDAESFSTARRAARDEGLLLGGSSGTCLAATLRYARRRAADLFVTESISQAPVVEGGQMIGAAHEITIMHALHQNVLPKTVRLREVMARPLPKVDAAVSLEEGCRLLLAGNPAVVVASRGPLSGIITRSDLMRFYDRDGH